MEHNIYSKKVFMISHFEELKYFSIRFNENFNSNYELISEKEKKSINYGIVNYFVYKLFQFIKLWLIERNFGS